MATRAYSKKKRQNHTRWHKGYNQEHNYATKQTGGARFDKSEEYLIWNKCLDGGRVLTDVQIAKLLKRSLQSIQLKRCKMKKAGGY